jgi:hypothetical protein
MDVTGSRSFLMASYGISAVESLGCSTRVSQLVSSQRLPFTVHAVVELLSFNIVSKASIRRICFLSKIMYYPVRCQDRLLRL